MKLDFRKYFSAHFSIYRLFFNLKKVELRFFYLWLFDIDASLNSNASMRPLLTGHWCIVTKTHRCGSIKGRTGKQMTTNIKSATLFYLSEKKVEN